MWRKSSFSEGYGNSDCVEVWHRVDGVDIRDTKDRSAGRLAIAPRAWTVFVSVLKGQ